MLFPNYYILPEQIADFFLFFFSKRQSSPRDFIATRVHSRFRLERFNNPFTVTHEYSAEAQWASIVSANFNFVPRTSMTEIQFLRSLGQTSARTHRTGPDSFLGRTYCDVKAHISVGHREGHQMSNSAHRHDREGISARNVAPQLINQHANSWLSSYIRYVFLGYRVPRAWHLRA